MDSNNNTDSLQPPTSSRPRSILNVSRSTALTPSLSSHTPLDQLSTSPSNRSIMSNGNRNGTNGNGGGYSALNRLKRVASNASIASSSKVPQTQRKAAPVTSKREARNVDQHEEANTVATLVDEGNSAENGVAVPSIAKTEDRSALAIPDAYPQPTDGGTSSTIKRPRSPPNRIDAATVKQARRKTWFGFGGGSASDDGDITMIDAADNIEEESHTQTGHKLEDNEDIDAEMTEVQRKDHNQPAPSKSWVAWRGPSEPSTGILQNQPSYTDTVLRYVSGTSSPTIPWTGWPLWRSNAEQQESTLHSNLEAEVDSTKVDDKTRSSMIAEGMATTAVSQPSLIERWWPSWRPVEKPAELPEEVVAIPPTPAEQVKAEALARMGVKDAVLNEVTRSTWINYFSSRSALTSSKVEDQDRGPEVMKLELDPAKQSASQAASTVKHMTTKGKGKEPVVDKDTKTSVKEGNDKKSNIQKPNVDPAPPVSRPSTPLTNDKEKANKVVKVAAATAALAKGKKGDNSSKSPKDPPPPNLLLPSFDDIFLTAPRSTPPSKGMLEKTLSYLFSRNIDDHSKRGRKSSLLSIGASRADLTSDQREHEAQTRLPRLWNVVGDKEKALTKGCKGIKKVSIIGVHGWFSQGPLRNLFGEPTGTSIKFATMMNIAVKDHFEKAGHTLKDDQISVIALEADGQVADRVNKSFSALISNPKWVADVLSADVVFIAAHSQGCIVATHLLARLIEQRHLDTSRTRVALLAMCGIHQGPFSHLRSSLATYYFNTFETPAAKELFEFQNSKSAVSMMYAASLRIIVRSGVKLIYVASMDDQVVPLYSALNSSASHPSILRAIFCDGAAFPRVDFLTNLLSFCAAVRNAGLSDHNLLTLLSASVAGSLYGGAGHSLVYEDGQVYSLAVRYLLEVTSPNSYPTTRSSDPSSSSSSITSNVNKNSRIGGSNSGGNQSNLVFEPFSTAESAKWNSNPFALPWSLRGLLEDEMVRKYFDAVIDKLLRDYNEWTPSTKTLKDVQFRLEPMRLVSRQSSPSAQSTSKL